MSGFKILVPIKRVMDYRVKVRIKQDNSDVDLANVKMGINPFDEIAVEEALRIKEKSFANTNCEIVVVSVGTSDSQETLRAALALGADRAILQEIPTGLKLYPLQIAKILKDVVSQETPDFIIMGKQAIDGDNNQTGQMLAGLLGWPQATFASKLVLEQNDKKLVVTREIDGGLETLEVSMPAVITTDLRLNEPRFASLPNIMKAKSKPLSINKVENLSLVNLPEVIEIAPPKLREAGIKVANIDELIEKLHKVEKLI